MIEVDLSDAKKKLMWLNIAKETLWWSVSALLAYIVLKPIVEVIDFKYLLFNILIILMPLHYFRYIVFFRKNIFLQTKWPKFFVFALNIQLCIQIIRITQDILVVVEEQSIQEVMVPNSVHHLSMNQIFHLLYYIKEELLGFAIAAVLVAVALNLRIMYSFFGFGTKRMQNFVSSSTTKK
jgi:hypothetical protein